MSKSKKTDGWETAGRVIGEIITFALQVYLLTIWWSWWAPEILHLDPLTGWQSAGIILTIGLLSRKVARSAKSNED